MKGVIKAPKGIITGAFTILLTFIRPIELTAADVHVETLEGDALGHSKDSFGGSGASYHILCYIPDERSGKSRISVVKKGLQVEPVTVAYDTIRTVRATWGTPIPRGDRAELPISFGVAIQNLKKRNFILTPASPFQIYGADDSYSLIVPRRLGTFSIDVSGTVRKQNGLMVSIEVD